MICHDHAEDLIPGQVVVNNEKYHFQELAKFGRPFLERFNMATSKADIVKDLWFVDTPRIDEKLDTKDRDALMWFAAKATRIVLLFDPKRIEFNTETNDFINQISKYSEKFLVVMNKATSLHEMQIVKLYGSLMWNLCSSMRTTGRSEELPVYITSFGIDGQNYNYKNRCSEMFTKDSKTLLDDLSSLPREYTKAKLNVVGKRGKKVRFHAMLMNLLATRMPRFVGKRSAQHEMKENLKPLLEEAAKTFHLKPNFFGYMERTKHLLITDTLSKYKKNMRMVEKIPRLLKSGIPILLKELTGSLTTFERDQELIRHKLKKGKAKKVKAKKIKKKRGSKRILPTIARSRAGSLDSNQSKRSVFSVVSVTDKIAKVFSRKKSRSSRIGMTKSQYNPGSIADDAFSNYSRSAKYKKPPRQISHSHNNRQTGVTTRSLVERSIADADDHIDLFSVTSENYDEDLFSVSSANQRRKGRKKPNIKTTRAVNLHEEEDDIEGDADDWAVPHAIRKEAYDLFDSASKNGKLNISSGLSALSRYHVPDRTLRKIWELCDFHKEGSIDADQCAVAVFLIKQAKSRKNVPKKVPEHLIPPSHR